MKKFIAEARKQLTIKQLSDYQIEETRKFEEVK